MRGKIVPFRRTSWLWATPPRRRRRSAWRLSSPFVAVVSALLVAFGAAQVAKQSDSPLTAFAGSIRVIDGDTIAANGEHVRLVGFNAPEVFSPACPAERLAGEAARDRLLQLVSTGTPDVVKVRCSCPPGTEGTPRCNYGRACGRLLVDGADVGAILISERLAVPYRCSRTRCPRLPRPWCG